MTPSSSDQIRITSRIELAGRIRVIQRKDLTYAVEITRPKRLPHTVIGFDSERETQDWIGAQRRKTEEAGLD
jgi:hypothetical protein